VSGGRSGAAAGVGPSGVELAVRDLESPEVFHLLARGDLDLAISMESDRIGCTAAGG